MEPTQNRASGQAQQYKPSGFDKRHGPQKKWSYGIPQHKQRKRKKIHHQTEKQRQEQSLE